MIIDTGTFLINTSDLLMECKICRRIDRIPFTVDELQLFGTGPDAVSAEDLNRRRLVLKNRIMPEMSRHAKCRLKLIRMDCN